MQFLIMFTSPSGIPQRPGLDGIYGGFSDGLRHDGCRGLIPASVPRQDRDCEASILFTQPHNTTRQVEHIHNPPADAYA